MKSNEVHENKEHPCRIVGCRETTQAPRTARTAGATPSPPPLPKMAPPTWLCPVHRAALRFSIRERAQLRALDGQLLQGQLMLSDDGWLTPVAPTPPKPQPIAYDDDGFPRYRDMGSPHGQTVRPAVDTLLGDAPRLDKYRDLGDDDGQQ